MRASESTVSAYENAQLGSRAEHVQIDGPADARDAASLRELPDQPAAERVGRRLGQDAADPHRMLAEAPPATFAQSISPW